MELYEREYFISRIRCGYYRITKGGVTLKVMPPHLEDVFLSQEHYEKTYNDAIAEGVMTEEETLDWMISNNLWSQEKEQKITAIEKEIENIQVKTYSYRAQPRLVVEGKKLLRQAEKALKDIKKEKQLYFSNTCEGIASHEKMLFVFERSCYLDSAPFEFSNGDAQNWFYMWAMQVLSEQQIRELSRNDPWRSVWSIKDTTNLFIKYDNRDLSPDQKNLITWSKMFDSIQESPDCPPDDILDDDDLLNGWLVIQRRESEKRKKNQENDQLVSEKIAGAQEILLMARNQEEANFITGLNDGNAKRIHNQRINTVKQKGKATDLDFQDRRLELQMEANQQFKNKLR
jgi:hypothetical protein